MDVNNSSNVLKQRIKYLIAWMVHYHLNNKNKIKIDNDAGSFDLDLNIKLTKIQSDPPRINNEKQGHLQHKLHFICMYASICVFCKCFIMLLI